MKAKDILKKYNISEATLRNWKKLKYIDNLDDIEPLIIDNIIKNKVGNRRNKRNSLVSIIPVSYIEDKRIVHIITAILELKERYDVSVNEVLHEAIIKIIKNHHLNIPSDIDVVLGCRCVNKEFIREFDKIKIEYSEDNDFLGCLYMSLLSIGKKDTNGIFYTPFKVVNKIIESTNFKGKNKIIDPSCGSGNFLIQAFKKMKTEKIPTSYIIEHLYGFDIDAIATLLAKINLYLLDRNITFDDINVYNCDFLNDDVDYKFDVVIGNPPWGKKYTTEEKLVLKEKYDLSFAKMDSFAQFIIKAFDILNNRGMLCFVLPSSILNIAAHEDIRKFLLKNKIEYIKKIGREFEEIVTDVVIIKVIKSSGKNNICLYDNKKVRQEDFSTNPYRNFLISDNTSSEIIKKIKNYPSFHLIDNVNYALGIVTGNNKKYIFNEPKDGTEPIILGKDINKYMMDYSKITKFIKYEKEKFQQVACEDFYRAKNKIIYKFIGKKLCFAIESKSMLTINSANVICLGDEYDIYYVVAILNSRITQLYFEDLYDTYKVLKNHIQAFYIPDFDLRTKKMIANLIKSVKPQKDYFEDVESIIYNSLGLTKEEITYLKKRF